MKIGVIEYNAVGQYFWQMYPGLQNGVLSYSFTSQNETYTLEIFYNCPCNSLYYNIKNKANALIQSQMVLAEYPTNLLVAFELKGYLYVKNYEIFYEDL